MKKILIKVVVLLFIVNGLCLSYLGIFDSKAVDYVYSLTSEGDVIGEVDKSIDSCTVRVLLPEGYYFDDQIEKSNIILNIPSELEYEIIGEPLEDIYLDISGMTTSALFDTLSIQIDGNYIYDDETTYQFESIFCNDISIPGSIIYINDGTISGTVNLAII